MKPMFKSSITALLIFVCDMILILTGQQAGAIVGISIIGLILFFTFVINESD